MNECTRFSLDAERAFFQVLSVGFTRLDEMVRPVEARETLYARHEVVCW